jgi:hypothetical protein
MVKVLVIHLLRTKRSKESKALPCVRIALLQRSTKPNIYQHPHSFKIYVNSSNLKVSLNSYKHKTQVHGTKNETKMVEVD